MSQTNTPSLRTTDPISGIHHITALAGDPQRNVDFYTGILGLRLVKKTVNFDDPGVYHLYYGDQGGNPGTILTFFPWPGARRGARGTGQATTTAFSVPSSSLTFWADRLTSFGVDAAQSKRFGDDVLSLRDPDGLQLELVAHGEADGIDPWSDGPVDGKFALRGFHSVALTVQEAGQTAELLGETMGWKVTHESGPRTRFAVDGPLATRVDLIEKPTEGPGRIAAGTVHHVAFRVADDSDELAWRDRLVEHGHRVTEVRDRQYFHSVYFREPGGVLFELATDPPGFTLDEDVSALGEGLKLPPWLESSRSRIEQTLPSIRRSRLLEDLEGVS